MGRRGLTVAVAVVAVATGLTGCGTTSGKAVPLATRPGAALTQLGNEQSVDFRTQFKEDPQSVNDYWSSDTARDAKPREPGTGGNNGAPIDGPTGVVVQPTDGNITEVDPAAVGDNANGDPWSKAGLSGGTNGRLYFVMGGQNYVCSGTVVNSGSQDIVATAGHCVWDTETGSGWAGNFLFIPADAGNGQTAPFGRWTAAAVYTTSEFKTSATSTEDGTSGDGWAYDIAFLKMQPLGGRSIQSVTGGQGIAFGIPAESLMVIGYPSAPPFDGTSERYCSSTSWNSSFYGDYGIACAMTPGSSGGGWFTRFDPNRGAGFLVGVTSVGGNGKLAAAQLGQSALATYEQAVSGA